MYLEKKRNRENEFKITQISDSPSSKKNLPVITIAQVYETRKGGYLASRRILVLEAIYANFKVKKKSKT